MKKIRYAIILVLAVIVGIIFWFLRDELNAKKKIYKIAYIGRYKGIGDDPSQIERSRQFNYLHEYSLREHISRFNNKSKIRVRLEIFDNSKHPDSTNSVYKKIQKDKSIIAVIDNSWGSELIGAQKTIWSNNIPIIAINGDKNDLDYGNSIFTGNGDNQVEEIIKFIKNGLRLDTVNFISETDYSLHKKYLFQFKKYEIHINNTLYENSSVLDTNSVNTESIFELANNKYLTVINTHFDIGNYFINEVNSNLSGVKMIGQPSTISNAGLNPFKRDNQLIILSQSENALPKAIADDIFRFKKNHPELELKFNTALFFKRCKDAWSIIDDYLESYGGELTRTSFSEYLGQLHGDHLNVGHDIFTFNKDGSMVRESTFVEYSSSGEKPFSLQLNSRGELIPNLNFGIEIIDIQDIDLNSNSFSADFYYWLTSDSSFADIDEYVTFQNIKPSESETQLINEKYFDNLKYKLYKVSGKFLEDYNERDFPFDKQEISIDIQILNTSENLRVSFDRESFRQRTDELKFKGWRQKQFYVTVDNTVTNRLKGNLELKDKELNKFKNISFRLKLDRSKLPGVLQIILPLFFIGMLSIALLFLQKLNFGNIGEPLAAAFLTIIAFSISLSDVTPTSNILTKTDYLFILTLVTVVSSFMIGLLHNVKNGLGKRATKKIRSTLAVLYTLIFMLVTFL